VSDRFNDPTSSVDIIHLLGGIMNRREFSILAGAALLVPVNAHAQRKVPTVGVLWHAANAEEEKPYFGALVDGFKSLGYVDGQNIKLEHRFPNETPALFKSMAEELVSKVDVIVSIGGIAAPYVRDAKPSVPFVFTIVSDPVGVKLVQSLARPGGNTTGLSHFALDLTGKRFQYLSDIVPGLSRIGLLINPNEPPSRFQLRESKEAAVSMKLDLHVFEARTAAELDAAFDGMVKEGVQAVNIGAGGLFFSERTKIGKLATARQLPTAVWSREVLEGGTLISYGPDMVDLVRRASGVVDKILKGTKPADIPVEQPTRFQLLVNNKVAKEMGLQLSPTFLTFADEVIE
jgi:putative tryptophan/tyrosine transport system substrate-binding protein